MIRSVKPRLFTDNNQIALAPVVIVNIILSAWMIFLTPTINDDGILYLLTGQTFLDTGFSEALSTYRWPFYSIAFATLSDVSPLSLVNAGHIITTAGFIVMSYAFTLIVAEMGGDRKTQLIALFVILFQPLYANYRASLIRDPIFLGFMLLTLVELIRYSKKPSNKTISIWMLYVGISFLARPEALIIALLSPLGLLLNIHKSFKERLKSVGKFTLIPLATLTIIASTLYALFPETITNTKPIDDAHIYFDMIGSLHQKIEGIALNVSEHALKHSSKRDAVFVTYVMFFSIFLINVFSALTPPYIALLLYGLFSKIDLKIYQPAIKLLIVFMAIISSYLLVFTFSRQFSLERYSFHLVILLMLYIPFIVNRLSHNNRHKMIKYAVIIIASGYFLDTVLNTNYKKDYIADAAHWTKENKGSNTLVTNIGYIACFGQVPEYKNRGLRVSDEAIVNRQYKNDHLYIINTKDRELDETREIIRKNKGEIVHTFPSDYGKMIIIFKKS